MSPPIPEFLDAAGWGGAEYLPLAGDASTRRYVRLRKGSESAIVVIAPPQDRAAFDAFLSVAAKLHDAGLSAPDIYSVSPEAGLMLLEDLGERSFAGTDLPPEAQDAAVDVSIHLARGSRNWTVPHLTPPVMVEMTAIALPQGGPATAALQVMETQFAQHFTRPPVPCLRDFHAENLIWLPERAGLARVGLLDFQDAVMAPPGYDLISLTHDARRDMAPEVQARLRARYGDALGHDGAEFSTECALLIFQRNLRILGVFRSLARDRCKPAYLRHLPRVFGHVEGALTHPALTDLARAMAPLLPGIKP
jgi:N-acetylmuramate 1-kinase